MQAKANMSLHVTTLNALKDNYIFVIRDEASDQTAVVDPSDATVVIEFLKLRGWKCDYLLNTHHHPDHISGNEKLKNLFCPQHFASAYDDARIPGTTKTFASDDRFKFGSHEVSVFQVPGHTLGHIAYFFSNSNLLFCGDTLFSLGCGRLFEGTAEQLFSSLTKISQLPPETKVYCSHEYTEANGRFAITHDPNNSNLIAYLHEVKAKRLRQEPTIPTTLKVECECNPFLRTHESTIKDSLGLFPQSTALECFTALRKAKDSF